jgi:acetate kinase
MRILALNCGSSSIKGALVETGTRARLLDLEVENLGLRTCRMRVGTSERPLASNASLAQGLEAVLSEVRRHEEETGRPVAVVHRVVHGGATFKTTTLLDDEVLGELERLSRLAPLHNPPALEAIRAARARYSDVPHYAAFDTAFHATLPRRAREYALPAELRAAFSIRRFGFHGINHAHVLNRVAAYMQAAPEALRVISCHLGNGASVTAIEYGRSVETSMGMTPLEGLVMGTRAGDLDPGILFELLRSEAFTVEKLEELLNKGAGLKGLTGTNDMREIERRAGQGDEECRLALALYSHRIRKYIGAYAAIMGGVDVIAFTGGVGENSALVRHRCLQRLDFLGAALDEDRNRDASLDAAADCIDISAEHARVRLLVVRADEELAMALDVAKLMTAKASAREEARIPIAVSARHAHLSRPTLDKLFGAGHELHPRTWLSQTGQFAATETVTLIGPRGRLEGVRLMGPPREHDQVEISRSDEFTLGVDAPVRLSGDLANTPGITLEGPAGRTTIKSGLICARRHIHMGPEDAQRLGVSDCDTVSVAIDSEGRDLVFQDVTVRVAPSFRLELHLDTDEANAAGVGPGDYARLVPGSHARS